MKEIPPPAICLESSLTLVYRSLAGTAPVYLADERTLVTAAGCRPLLIIEHAW